MHPILDTQLADAAAIVGANDATEEAIDAQVHALLGDRLLARRVIDWLPEAFALVLIPNITSVKLPTTFSARTRNGSWIEFRFDAEPIIQSAIHLGADMYVSGPRDLFRNVVNRSSLLAVVDKALNGKHDLKGVALSGPALIGVPAEVYLPQSRSLWGRLVR
jgi:hypothetical protein